MEKPTKPKDFVRVVDGNIHDVQVYVDDEDAWRSVAYYDKSRFARATEQCIQKAILAACELAVEAYIEKLRPPYPYQPVTLPATLDAIDRTRELFCDEDEDAEAREE